MLEFRFPRSWAPLPDRSPRFKDYSSIHTVESPSPHSTDSSFLSIHGLIEQVREDSRSQDHTRGALVNRLEMAQGWDLFSVAENDLSEILDPFAINVLDLSVRIWLLIDEAQRFVLTGRSTLSKEILITWAKEERQLSQRETPFR